MLTQIDINPFSFYSPYMAKKILLAEDDLQIQAKVQQALNQAGYDCCAVNDGSAAVQKFSQARYDLLIFDGDMPLLNGFETIRRIRQIEKARGFAPTPALLHSSMRPVNKANLDATSGFDAFIPKRKAQDLIIWVRRFLGT